MATRFTTGNPVYITVFDNGLVLKLTVEESMPGPVPITQNQYDRCARDFLDRLRTVLANGGPLPTVASTEKTFETTRATDDGWVYPTP